MCERTTCEYFRVASDVVAKSEEQKGGQEVEEIVPRLKVFPEDSSSHLCLTASVHVERNIQQHEKTEVCTFLNRRRISEMPPRSWLEVM